MIMCCGHCIGEHIAGCTLNCNTCGAVVVCNRDGSATWVPPMFPRAALTPSSSPPTTHQLGTFALTAENP
jgi:hypothetical protein